MMERSHQSKGLACAKTSSRVKKKSWYIQDSLVMLLVMAGNPWYFLAYSRSILFPASVIT